MCQLVHNITKLTGSLWEDSRISPLKCFVGTLSRLTPSVGPESLLCFSRTRSHKWEFGVMGCHSNMHKISLCPCEMSTAQDREISFGLFQKQLQHHLLKMVSVTALI